MGLEECNRRNRENYWATFCNSVSPFFLVCNSCYCGFHANFSELLTGCDETSLKCQAGNMMLKKGLVITFKRRKNISELNNNFENRTKIDLFLNFVLEGN